MSIECYHVLIPEHQEGSFVGFKRQGCVVDHKWRIHAG